MTRPSLLSTFCAVFRKPRDPQGRPLNDEWHEKAYHRFFDFDAIVGPCLLTAAALGGGKFIGSNSVDPQAVYNAAAIVVLSCPPAYWGIWAFIRVRYADINVPRFETAPSYLARFRIRGGPERERAFNNGLSMFVWLSRKLDDDMSELRKALIDVQEAGMRWREDSYRLPEAQEARGHFALVTLAEYADRMYRDETLRASPAARGDLKQAAAATRALLDSILTGRETAEVSDFTSGVRALSNQIGAGPALVLRTQDHGHA